MADDDKKPDQEPKLPPNLQQEADALMAESDGPDAPPQGAPPPADQGGGVQTGAVLTDLLDVTFNGFLAKARGPHWKMDADETKALGYAYGAVIDKYFPNLDAGVEVTAILVTVAVIGPRYAADVAAHADDEPDTPDEPPAAPAADKPKGEPPSGDSVFVTADGAS